MQYWRCVDKSLRLCRLFDYHSTNFSSSTKFRPNRTHCIDVAYCDKCRFQRGLSVCLSVGQGEPCKNGWTDRDAVWGLTYVNPRSDESIRRREGWQRRRCGLSSKFFDPLFNPLVASYSSKSMLTSSSRKCREMAPQSLLYVNVAC